MRKKMNDAIWDFIAGFHRLDDFVDFFLKDNDIDRLTPTGLTHEKRLRKVIGELRDNSYLNLAIGTVIGELRDNS